MGTTNEYVNYGILITLWFGATAHFCYKNPSDSINIIFTAIFTIISIIIAIIFIAIIFGRFNGRKKFRWFNYKNENMNKIKELIKELGYKYEFNKFDGYNNKYDNITILDNNINISDLENETYHIIQKEDSKRKIILEPLYLGLDETLLILKETKEVNK